MFTPHTLVSPVWSHRCRLDSCGLVVRVGAAPETATRTTFQNRALITGKDCAAIEDRVFRGLRANLVFAIVFFSGLFQL